MVNNSTIQLDRVFGALADPTRRAILERLAWGEAPVTELASPFSSSLPAISKHLNVLEEAGLIVRRVVGRRRICRMQPLAMETAASWIDHYRSFWNMQLDSLEESLRLEMEEENGNSN